MRGKKTPLQTHARHAGSWPTEVVSVQLLGHFPNILKEIKQIETTAGWVKEMPFVIARMKSLRVCEMDDISAELCYFIAKQEYSKRELRAYLNIKEDPRLKEIISSTHDLINRHDFGINGSVDIVKRYLYDQTTSAFMIWTLFCQERGLINIDYDFKAPSNTYIDTHSVQSPEYQLALHTWLLKAKQLGMAIDWEDL